VDHTKTEALILLLHDGELRDVRALLDEVGVSLRERLGPLRPAEARAAWRTVIATPKRLLDFKALPSGPRPTLVSIADGCSNTLRAQMQRLRVDFMVDRPVHPTALRLLLLHVLYRGPERRKLDRISIGAPARIKVGLFSKPAILAEISPRGARIVSEHRLAPGTKLKLVIGRELTKSGALRLAATVARVIDADGQLETGLRFAEPSAKAAKALNRFLDLHRRGPVQIRHHVPDTRALPVPALRSSAAATGAVTAAPAAPSPPASVAPPATAPTAVGARAEHDEAPSDRRSDSRRAYDNRVVALSEEAARVFIGRDISSGGMRVDSHPELGLGARLRLALHAGPRSEPVLVEALVDRDDGDGGVFLRFCSVDDRLQRELDLVIGRLGFSTSEPDESSAVVSELIGVESSRASG